MTATELAICLVQGVLTGLGRSPKNLRASPLGGVEFQKGTRTIWLCVRDGRVEVTTVVIHNPCSVSTTRVQKPICGIFDLHDPDLVCRLINLIGYGGNHLEMVRQKYREREV